MMETEHAECRDYDAHLRAELIRQIASVSAAAREQAHRSLDTAIRSTATPDDRDTHRNDVIAAHLLRRAMDALGHDP